ncbi:hypothetical protein BGZ68_001545 [Mortierella alpina]|nr:hypothetical protein BGZ68_001545 [Mortierella alpina]
MFARNTRTNIAEAVDQLIGTRARAHESELVMQDVGDEYDQDAHVPRSNTYDEESDYQDCGHDRGIDFEISDDD